ncbi:DMSO reductase anchor subunit [Slackia heliotrinireducens]|uniref:DMSO reductase anchor subunit n=1 Tax=Slackia heliotrinireducens (strain ATCC 29202 / DSM 20476 / NCTC 11029 / RHS 1) TaxID=471855 RepID=C7N4B0_SLAHD|nr:DmsC/YnfH family molybdoenzyme membrane anchor subunit [Slackia heliotrinireducens]ACV21745.1 DMSO reductase anchor subunit [Slackia heliotrinireducens DSM 20476]VEG99392.1 DMSO reductase anchor subunit [Slackia heliotrinireducens]
METGFNGQTLAVFTALAPAGAVAFLCLALFLGIRGRSLEESQVVRLYRFIALPLAAGWFGFIASATHLGTPANALYVALGVGRSPLSNEVATTILFLLFAGVLWLVSFRERPLRGLMRVLCVLCVAAAFAMLAFMSVAYNVESVPSWDTWHTPVNLLLTALFSGCALGSYTLLLARIESRMFPKVLLWASAAALVVGSVFLYIHMNFLTGVVNNETTAIAEVPWYPAAIIGHILIGAVGLAIQYRGLDMRITSTWRARVIGAFGLALVLVSAVIVRLPFYEAYLSIGF